MTDIQAQPPWRKSFDYARSPYDARVALGLGNEVASMLTIQTYLLTTPVTVANLPAPGIVGRRGFVINATVTTFASIVTGSGANGIVVYDDGTNWRIG